MLRQSLFILCLVCLNACAFTQVTLTPPKDSLSTGLSGGKGRRVAVVVPMEDKRSIRNRCGMQKNGFNMDTADVVCTKDPMIWLPELLATELSNAGFQVEKSSQLNSETLQVQGQLLHFFLEPKIGFWLFSPEADIDVILTVKSGRGMHAERRFYTKGVEASLVGVESNVQKASDSAVRAIVKNMVVAIIELSQNYPQ